MPAEDYTAATAVAAEGARVGFVSCKRCGAALILDGRDETNVIDLHDEWHGRITDSTERNGLDENRR